MISPEQLYALADECLHAALWDAPIQMTAEQYRELTAERARELERALDEEPNDESLCVRMSRWSARYGY